MSNPVDRPKSFWSRVGKLAFLGSGILTVGGALAAGVAISTSTQQEAESMALLAATSIAAGVSLLPARHLLGGLPEARLFVMPPVLLTAVAAMGAVTAIQGDARPPALVAIAPALAGSWLAAWWVDRLASAGVSVRTRLEATTTARGLAWAWTWIFGLALVGSIIDEYWKAADASESLSHALQPGVASLMGLAAMVAYGGRGYTEYKKAMP